MGKAMFGSPSLEKKRAKQCSEALHWKKNGQSNVRKPFIGKKMGKVTFGSPSLEKKRAKQLFKVHYYNHIAFSNIFQLIYYDMIKFSEFVI